MAKKSDKFKSKKKSINKDQEKLDQSIAELTEDLKRVQADFVNYKRRTETERDQLVTLGKAIAVKNLLSVIDSFERALTSAPDNEFGKGVKSVYKQLEKSLKDLGVERIETLNQEFDPEFMEAVSTDDSEGEENQVVEELQSGYKINQELIRPAMVKVRK